MEELTPIENQALCLLAAGYSNPEVASQTGVSTRTIERWKKKPQFKKLLQDAVTAVFDAAIAELISGSREAAKQLKEIISDPDVPSRTKVTAITVLFSNGARAKDWGLEQRLARLEATLDGTDPSQDTEA